MTTITENNATELFWQTLRQAFMEGTMEGKFRDLSPVTLHLTRPQDNIVSLPKNWAWAFQEAFDRFAPLFNSRAKFTNPGIAYHHRSNWKKKLAKEGGTFDYSYGEIFAEQLPALITELSRRRSTREAILAVWQPRNLIQMDTFQRRPCTLNLHFMLRDKKLNLYATMRSNDIINLLPYDIFHHTLLQQLIAKRLKFELGEYYHFASHMYYHKKRETVARGYVQKTLSDIDSRDVGNAVTHNLLGDWDSIQADFQVVYSLYEGLEELSLIPKTTVKRNKLRDVLKNSIEAEIQNPLISHMLKHIVDSRTCPYEL